MKLFSTASMGSTYDPSLPWHWTKALSLLHTEKHKLHQMSAVHVLITFSQSIEHIKSSLPKTNKVFLSPADPY